MQMELESSANFGVVAISNGDIANSKVKWLPFPGIVKRLWAGESLCSRVAQEHFK